MVTVDLKSPTIAPETRVWRLFPGQGYRFLEAFEEQRIGFLDFPGLELPEGDLAEARDLIPRIARSQRIREALRSAEDDDGETFDLADFTGARVTQHRQQLRAALINFYKEAKINDYVVVPEPAYNSKVWIGRFASNTIVRGNYFRRYGDAMIPSRRIDWTQAYPESIVSAPLSQSLRHQHPFALLERNRFLEVLSLAHGSFIYNDRHVSTIYNDRDEFLDADGALLGVISRLSAAAAQAADNEGDGAAIVDLIDILLRTPPIEYTCNQETDIHSPGFNRYIGGTITALVIAATTSAFIALAQTSSRATIENDIQNVQVTNTAAGADPMCTARVSDASGRVLRMLGIDRTWALCEAARAANERAGMRSSAPATAPAAVPAPRAGQH